MIKEETILEIQKLLKSKKGFPELYFLNKLTKQECYWLYMDLIMLKNKDKEKQGVKG